MIVIPARMASTRFPGKPLVDLNGKPMVQWVYEAAQKAGCAEEVAVATPDQDIAAAVESFGGKAVLTSINHPSGTDRIAEVARSHSYDGYVNVQGDEPLIRPEAICAVAAALAGEAQVASAYHPCSESEYNEPTAVKVVLDKEGNALYFSRFPIPYPRNPRCGPVWKHIGIYGYSRDAVLGFPDWPVGRLEAAESLEQLRFLENGLKIKMVQAEPTETAIDTPEQADIVRRLLAQRQHQ